jgi:DNA-directed RNA polymerase specialized sigma24 family protein
MGFELFAALERDWQVVAASPAADAAVRRWATDAVLGQVAGVAEILERTAPGQNRAMADSILGALMRRAGRDEFAARVALQALTPGLLTLARRMGAAHDPDVAPEVVTAALARIKCYPCERRPRAVAANVILDVLAAVCRSRSAAGREMATPPERFHRVVEPEPVERTRPDAREVLEIAARSGRLPKEQLQLVFDAVLDQVPVSAAAARAGISTKAMTRRRERARASVVRAYYEARAGGQSPSATGDLASPERARRQPVHTNPSALERDLA